MNADNAVHMIRTERNADTCFLVSTYEGCDGCARATAQYSGKLLHVPHAVTAIMHLVTRHMESDTARENFISNIMKMARDNLLDTSIHEINQSGRGDDILKQYRHKPATIRAIQYDGTLEMREQILLLFPDHFGVGLNDESKPEEGVLCFFHDADTDADPVCGVLSTDWVIEGIDCVPYVCKDELFRQLYEETEVVR